MQERESVSPVAHTMRENGRKNMKHFMILQQQKKSQPEIHYITIIILKLESTLNAPLVVLTMADSEKISTEFITSTNPPPHYSCSCLIC